MVGRRLTEPSMIIIRQVRVAPAPVAAARYWRTAMALMLPTSIAVATAVRRAASPTLAHAGAAGARRSAAT